MKTISHKRGLLPLLQDLDTTNNWYIDSRANDHIISDIEELAIQDKYTGNDQIHMESGSGKLHLNKIVCVP
jgi:hypothetical protein